MRSNFISLFSVLLAIALGETGCNLYPADGHRRERSPTTKAAANQASSESLAIHNGDLSSDKLVVAVYDYDLEKNGCEEKRHLRAIGSGVLLCGRAVLTVKHVYDAGKRISRKDQVVSVKDKPGIPPDDKEYLAEEEDTVGVEPLTQIVQIGDYKNDGLVIAKLKRPYPFTALTAISAVKFPWKPHNKDHDDAALMVGYGPNKIGEKSGIGIRRSGLMKFFKYRDNDLTTIDPAKSTEFPALLLFWNTYDLQTTVQGDSGGPVYHEENGGNAVAGLVWAGDTVDPSVSGGGVGGINTTHDITRAFATAKHRNWILEAQKKLCALDNCRSDCSSVKAYIDCKGQYCTENGKCYDGLYEFCEGEKEEGGGALFGAFIPTFFRDPTGEIQGPSFVRCPCYGELSPASEISCPGHRPLPIPCPVCTDG